MSGELRHRPGDQPLPVPNDGPSMHDLVYADLASALAPDEQKRAARSLIRARKQLGISRYGSILQAHNGRSWLRDLAEEIADATCYAKQGREEGGSAGDLGYAYPALLHLLCQVAAALEGDSS